MVNEILKINPCGLDKRFNLKCCVCVRLKTHKEGRRMHRLKRYEYNNKDRENTLCTLLDKNY